MKSMATVERLNDDLKQTWSKSGSLNRLKDQFGNYIYGTPGNYTLENQDHTIKGLHCINSAKEIAKILVNDKFV